jgi:RND family efflux transporter MFP subunit
VEASEAMVRQAELDLDFTELRAPITGRIGDRRLSPGNLVTGGTGGSTTLLAVIVSTDPIRFEFTFDEASLLRYERLARLGESEIASRGGSTVRLRLMDERDFTHVGRMDFVDNVVERSTGTIRARAQLANPHDLFTPGMFARVQIAASAPYEALLVPDVAIASEQVRKYVLVVDGENVAQQRFVTLGGVLDGLRVIKEGLSADERVIVQGLMQARAGAKVAPEEQSAAPQASVPHMRSN